MKQLSFACVLTLIIVHAYTAHANTSQNTFFDGNSDLGSLFSNNNSSSVGLGVSPVNLYQSDRWSEYRDPKTGALVFGADSPVEQKGRLWFMAATTAKSAYIFPEMYSLAFKNLEDKTRTGLTLLSIGATLFGTYGLTKDIEMGYGRAALMNYGATLGYVYPLQLSILLHNATTIDQLDSAEHRDGILPTEKVRAWATLLSVPYGIYAGWRAPAIQNTSFGDASVMIYFSQTLGAAGYALPLMRWNPSEESQRKTYYTASSALSMVMIPVGMAIGRRLSQEYQFSSGSGMMLYVTGAMGAATGYFLPKALGYDEDMTDQQRRNLYLGAGAAGYAFGSFVGLNMNKESGVTLRQALFTGGSAIAGGLIGASLPYFTDIEKESTYMLAATAGSWLGLAIGNELAQKFRENSFSQNESGITMSLPATYNLPLILASAKDSKKSNSIQFPMLNVNYRF